MPRTAWTGYGRFCPLSRALDVVGDRWSLVIVQELQKRTSRYSDLHRRLPGIGTTVLADRLRKLEAADVVERVPGPVGEGVAYALTDRGTGLGNALEALRRWGVEYLLDPTADGSASHDFDLHYVAGIDDLGDADFELVVDDQPTTLHFAGGHLHQTPGAAAHPQLTVRTTSAFMDRWAAGTASWDDGRRTDEVTLDGDVSQWTNWLAATGYLLAYTPEPVTPRFDTRARSTPTSAELAEGKIDHSIRPHGRAVTPPNAGADLFQQVTEQLLADPAISRSTMMGYPCLRAGGAFFACVERGTGHLIVKLPRQRVADLVAAGLAVPFAPNGRVFREWAAVIDPDPHRWHELLGEARSFVSPNHRTDTARSRGLPMNDLVHRDLPRRA